MKKLLALFAIAVTSLASAQSEKPADLNQIAQEVSKTTYSDAKDATATVYNDGKSLVQQVYSDAKSLAPDLKEAFKSVASALNTTAEKLWDILVKQQLVWSICHAIILLSSIYAWYQFYRIFYKSLNDKTETGEYKAPYVLLLLLVGGLAVFGSLHTVDNIDRMITGFVNPEFGAVRTIVEFLNK